MAIVTTDSANYTAIANAIRNKTGSADTYTPAQMAEAIEGIIGGSDESYPIKFYETDFVVDETLTSNGTICTISTGLNVDYISNNYEIIFAVITCEAMDTSHPYCIKNMQKLSNNQNALNAGTPLGNVVRSVSGELSRRVVNAGAYIYTTGSKIDLSSLTIYGRVDAASYPVAGNYHLELYRTGFAL